MMCLATLFLEGKKLPRTIFFVQPLHRFESKIISRIKRDLAPSHLLRNILPLSSSSEVFTQKEIDRIVFDPLHFAKTLSLFDSKESPLLLVGEKYGDWLLALGRINLFHQMVIKVREKGFISIFSGQWKTIVFPKAKPLDMAAYAISQFTLVFAPFMTTLLGQGKAEELHHWIEQLIKWLTVGGVIVFFSVLLLGNDLVPLVLGAAYQPVVTNLLTLFITLWVQVLVNVATLLTVVYNRPKIAMMAAGVQLDAMLVFGPFLITRWGSWGGVPGCLGSLTNLCRLFYMAHARNCHSSVKKMGMGYCFGITFSFVVMVAVFLDSQCGSL